MENKVSLDNGRSYMTAHETIMYLRDMEQVTFISFGRLWDVIVYNMDDEIREAVHAELSPCSPKEFLKRYLELSGQDFLI